MPLLEKFKKQMPLYEMPHKNKNLMNEEEKDFEPDYSFIEIVNNEEYKSPWVAKMHGNHNNHN